MEHELDLASGFKAALERAGLSHLPPGDLAVLRVAYARARKPLPLPHGFSITAPPANAVGPLFVTPCE